MAQIHVSSGGDRENFTKWIGESWWVGVYSKTAILLGVAWNQASVVWMDFQFSISLCQGPVLCCCCGFFRSASFIVRLRCMPSMDIPSYLCTRAVIPPKQGLKQTIFPDPDPLFIHKRGSFQENREKNIHRNHDRRLLYWEP